MPESAPRRGSWLVWSLAAILVAANLALLAVASGGVLEYAGEANPRVVFWALILGAGILGGLVFSAREGRVVFPHRDPTEAHVWIPGILGDCLAGLAGSVVVFLVMPFEPKSANPEGFEWMKILGLAIVGGYGGRLLVEKVLSERIHEIEAKILAAESKERRDVRALELLEQQLDPDPERPEVSKAELEEALAGVSLVVRAIAFEKARRFRREAIEEGLGRLPRVYPVFEALIATDDEKQRHRYHAELAYAFKSRAETLSDEHADERAEMFRQAAKRLDQAIKARDEQKVEGYKVYEFVRAIVRIHLSADAMRVFEDLQSAFEAGGEPRQWIEHPQIERDRPLVDWLTAQRAVGGAISEWIAQNVELPAVAPPVPAPTEGEPNSI